MSHAQILVVEDEGLVARDIQRSLTRWGYTVPAVVPSGEDAVKKVEEFSPDLVLMDIRLKGPMTGIEAGEQVRDRFDVPVVFLTAYADDAILARAKRAEPFGYLVKPFEERELRATVEMALHKHRLEAYLRANEEWLASILEHIGDGVIVTDATGSIEFLNPAAEQMTGWPCIDARGKGLAEVFPVIQEGTGRPLDPAAEAFRTGATMDLDPNALLVARDPRKVPIEGSMALLHDGGTFVGFAVAFRDISRRREAERRALEWQRRHLQRQKREALARLAGGVASDFNNMLTIITGYSELLLAGGSADDSTRRFLEEISHAAERAASVARQLQAFSGGQMIVPQVVDLNGLLARVVKVICRLAGDGIEVSLQPDPNLDRVRVDPLQMEQVILDLVVNACEAMDGHGTLSLQTGSVHLDEEKLQPDYKVPSGSYVLLSLSHSGAVLDDEARAHLFDPYFTARKGERPGPGLATVYGILKQSGGYIEVAADAEGTCFRIYLPAVVSPEPAPPTPGAATTPLQGTETVLLVEDEDAVRGLACKVLRRAGYSVLEAHGGPEALRICQAHDGPIHLLVTDMMMQGMTGNELAKALRPVRPETRALFLSGHWGGALVQEGLLDPNAVFLQKPFSAEALLRTVREVIERAGS